MSEAIMAHFIISWNASVTPGQPKAMAHLGYITLLQVWE